MKVHLKKVHDIEAEKRDHICEQCGKSYSNSSSLYTHQQLKHGQNFYICTLCDKMVTARKKLQDHLRSVHSVLFIEVISRSIYVCPECKTTYNSSSTLNEHLVTEHGATQEHQCNECSMNLVSKNLLTAHLMECHNFNPLSMENSTQVEGGKNIKIQSKQFQCDICKQFLKSKITLQNHIVQNHEKESHKYRCSKCDYSTYENGKLNQHIKSKHRDAKDFKCDQCDFVTNFVTLLNKHKRTVHEKKKRFSCEHCNRGFDQKPPFLKHLLNEHDIVHQSVYSYKK